jgi:hypothetical protein
MSLEPGGERVALVDLLDRLLAGGVVLVGDVTISLAGVDLVHISLRALISSVSTLTGTGPDARVAAPDAQVHARDAQARDAQVYAPDNPRAQRQLEGGSP